MRTTSQALDRACDLQDRGIRKVYLAGAMTGKPDFGYAEFNSHATRLRMLGFEVVNPVEVDAAVGHDVNEDGAQSHADYMARDVPASLACDAIVVLPDYVESTGARIETAVFAAVGKGPILNVETLDEVDAPVIEFAAKVISTEDVARLYDVPAAMIDGEVRATHSTGAQKGRKLAMFSLIPGRALAKVAAHYGKGAEKYDAHNWRSGYPWSWSIDALLRHAFAYSDGETLDAETGSSHMAAVAFHALSLLTFEDEHPELDDRWDPVTVEGVASAA